VWLRQAQFRQVRKEAAVSLLLGCISAWSLFFIYENFSYF